MTLYQFHKLFEVWMWLLFIYSHVIQKQLRNESMISRKQNHDLNSHRKASKLIVLNTVFFSFSKRKQKRTKHFAVPIGITKETDDFQQGNMC